MWVQRKDVHIVASAVFNTIGGQVVTVVVQLSCNHQWIESTELHPYVHANHENVQCIY